MSVLVGPVLGCLCWAVVSIFSAFSVIVMIVSVVFCCCCFSLKAQAQTSRETMRGNIGSRKGNLEIA